MVRSGQNECCTQRAAIRLDHSQGDIPKCKSPILMKFDINVVFEKKKKYFCFLVFFLFFFQSTIVDVERVKELPLKLGVQDVFCQISRKLLKTPFLCRLIKFFNNEFEKKNLFQNNIFFVSFSK